MLEANCRPIRPLVRLHYVQSLDGRIARLGRQTRLSTSEGLVLAHRARAEHDAVLVGGGTLRIDDPRLTVRECEGSQPRRVILSSKLDVSSSAKVFSPGGKVVIIGLEGGAHDEDHQRLVALGAEVVLVPADGAGLLSLPAALRTLHAMGVERLLVEGGSLVLTSFLRQRLADEVTIEIAPLLFGEPSLCAFGRVSEAPFEATPRLQRVTVERAGESLLVRGSLVY
jgi:riboflavin-specific deaminase-like protein